MVESMKLRRKKYAFYPAHFPSSMDKTGSSEPRLGHRPLLRKEQLRRKPPRELSYQSPIQIWDGSPSKATGHISGSTNRFPSPLPRDAAVPVSPSLGPVSARAAALRSALCPGARPCQGPAGTVSLCPSPGDTASLRPDEGDCARVGLLFSPSA
ncbi:unnamed protein product [Coccothraustes coccothraustes]